jgi:hypothetical protein
MKTFEDKIDLTLRDFAAGMQRPTESEDVWGPLHKVVPKKWQDGFMYMGKYRYQTPSGPTVEVYDYKHGITRNYLHIDKKGNCYCNVRGYTETTVTPCLRSEALDIVYKDLELFGATRETPYDEQYRYQRNKALAEAGYTVLGVSPGKFTKKTKDYDYKEEM